MPSVNFNYKELCDIVSAGIKSQERPDLKALLDSCLDSSQQTLQSPKFLKRFESSPDTIETQVDMYAVLLDNACLRLARRIKTVEPNADEAKNLLSNSKTLLRAGYFVASLTPNSRLTAYGRSMFQTYVEERLEAVAAGEKPTLAETESVMEGYFSKLKVNDFIDSTGLMPKLLDYLNNSGQFNS